MHPEGLAMDAMSWLVAGKLGSKQQAQAMSTYTWYGLIHQCEEGTLIHQMLSQMGGARCLAQRALIKDMLMGTLSQEAPCEEGGSLLGRPSSSLAGKA